MLFRSICRGIRSLLRPAGRNAEIEAEIQSFLESAVEHKLRQGMSHDDAERAAHAEIGSSEMVRHKVWAAGWESHAESLWRDARYGFRQLLRSPGLSVVAILSLALGIGANTAIFTMLDDLLLKQLPVRDPKQLLSFGKGSNCCITEPTNPGPYDMFPYEFYRRLGQKPQKFQGLTAFASFPSRISVHSDPGTPGAASQATCHLVSGTFFQVLGADPLLGRTFNAEDTAAVGRNPVAVISHGYWQRELASDPAVIGRTIVVGVTPFTIIGVMPPQFYGVTLNEQLPDMWLPITMQPEVMERPSLLGTAGPFWIDIIARRNPDIPVAETQSWVTTQFRQFLVDRAGGHPSPGRMDQIRSIVVPLVSSASGNSYLRDLYERPLLLLMAIVAIVLLIACANLANLLLAKSDARKREFSTRRALGCSRGRIVRQIFAETLVLAFLGGALGLTLAFLGTRILIAFVTGNAAHTALSPVPDLRVLVFTASICIFTGLLFGIAPALRGSRMQVTSTLSGNVRTTVSTRAGRLLPRAMIVAQITVSLVLLTVAGLLLRTLRNLHSQDLGFRRNNLLLIETNPKFAGYHPEQLNALYRRILDRIDGLPGVRSATLSGGPPQPWKLGLSDHHHRQGNLP